jgi:hypothetical protein
MSKSGSFVKIMINLSYRGEAGIRNDPAESERGQDAEDVADKIQEASKGKLKVCGISRLRAILS